MSSSLANARRKFDASVRSIHLPTDIDPQDPEEPGFKTVEDRQSRLNWSSSIFPRYRHDNIFQPRRAANTRKKWPNMPYIGTYTLHLGPHVFPETSFYEAVRQESWYDVGIAAGVAKPLPLPKVEVVDTPMLSTPDSTNLLSFTQAPDVSMTDASQQSVTVDEVGETISQSIAMDSTEDSPAASNNTVTEPPPTTEMASSTANTVIDTLQTSATTPKLTYYDIVFEFKEVPNERFVFPKDAIAESIQDQREVLLSFILPLDPVAGEDYFRDPMEKIALWGDTSQDTDILAAIPAAQQAQKESKATVKEDDEKEKTVIHQPVTIKLEGADEKIWNAIAKTLKPLDVVQQSMMEKMQTIPVRHFLQYRSSFDTADDAIETLKNKINTIPEVVNGPVAAEKKRNELLNAIKLGKRPRSDYQEHETAAQKRSSMYQKDDNLRKCHYCGTRQTSMWRRGPDGGGTLCNGCGLRWKQGEILIGAPVISWQEEKRLAKERKKKEESLEAELLLEQDKAETPVEKKRPVKHSTTRSSDTVKAGSEQSTTPSASLPKNIGYVAAQIVQHQHQQAMLQNSFTAPRSVSGTPVVTPAPIQSAPPPPTPQGPVAPKVSTRKKSVGKPIAQAPASTSTSTPATTASRLMASAPAPTPTAVPLNAVQQSVTSGAGIPLPTLSILFSDTIAFTHPNCGVALLEDVFSIKLRKDGHLATTIDIYKHSLQQSRFDIVFEGEARREILVMSTTLTGHEAVTRFDQKLIDPQLITKQHDIKIRFLEKLDPSGGGVVKRILERWVSASSLASISGTSSPLEPSSASSKPKDTEETK
ncbi:unnamed protein product [Umbelopsis vinacea]